VEYADKAEMVRARAGLMHDLRDAEAELQAADAAALPFEQAFSRAHARLREALEGEAALRPFYDARLAAGHAAHPYRQRVRDARAWVDSVVGELSEIDRQLSAPDRAMAKRPKRQLSLF